MIAAAIFLCSLPLQAGGLITTDAKCLPGYNWMFSSIGQSPCDVAVELASVCPGEPFSLEPLPDRWVYNGPTETDENSCRCSSVFYSLLSGCAYCQGRNYHRWSIYITNCSIVYLTVYNQEIPVGVKVPAYAYQNVSISDSFNVTLAESVGGFETSRPSPSSTSSSAIASTSGSHGGSTKNTPAIIGGVVGGIVGLILLTSIPWFLFSMRRIRTYDESFEMNPNTDVTSNTTPPVIPAPPGPSEDTNDLSKYSPSLNSPYREHSPPFRFQTMAPNDMGNEAQNLEPPQTIPQYTGGPSHYSGMPEL